jgi:hypothetical protein
MDHEQNESRRQCVSQAEREIKEVIIKIGLSPLEASAIFACIIAEFVYMGPREKQGDLYTTFLMSLGLTLHVNLSDDDKLDVKTYRSQTHEE